MTIGKSAAIAKRKWQIGNPCQYATGCGLRWLVCVQSSAERAWSCTAFCAYCLLLTIILGTYSQGVRWRALWANPACCLQWHHSFSQYKVSLLLCISLLTLLSTSLVITIHTYPLQDTFVTGEMKWKYDISFFNFYLYHEQVCIVIIVFINCRITIDDL